MITTSRLLIPVSQYAVIRKRLISSNADDSDEVESFDMATSGVDVLSYQKPQKKADAAFLKMKKK